MRPSGLGPHDAECCPAGGGCRRLFAPDGASCALASSRALNFKPPRHKSSGKDVAFDGDNHAQSQKSHLDAGGR